jgi:hypothetical protein
MTAATYETVQQHRRTLLELAEREATIIEALDVETHKDLITGLRARLTSDAFKILVLGDFRRGKSTFINALLGEKVLPSFAYPTTATVNEVKYDATRRAVLFPLPADGSRAEPFEIPIEDLERHVTIDDDDPDKPNPYAKAEVYWPLELCRNGVELVDSPGLNEDAVRTAVTMGYLALADAVILLLSAEQFLAENEQRFIELNLQPMGYDNVFYVTNKINRVESDERDGVIARARKRAKPFLDGREDRLFFVNAKGALEARRTGDALAWEESAVGDVERYLERFLVESRGRAKVLGPARELRSAMSQIRRTIIERESLLAVDVEELRKRYAQAQEPLARLERRRDEIVRSIEAHNAETRLEVLQAVRRQLEYIADSAPAKAAEIETTAKLALNPLRAAEAREAFSRELGEKLSHQLRTEFAEWLAGDFQKLLLRRAEHLEAQLGSELADFERRVDQVRFDLGALANVDSGPTPSGGQRIAAAVAGFLLVDVTSAYTGSMYGFKEMAKSAVPRLAIIITGVALAFNPFAIIALLLGTAVIDTLLKKGAAEKKIRAAAGEQARDELRHRAGSDAEAVTAQLDEQLVATREAVVSALTNEVEDVRNQVRAVLAEKEQGERTVQQSRRQLQQYSADIDVLNEQLDDLIHAVAG